MKISPEKISQPNELIFGILYDTLQTLDKIGTPIEKNPQVWFNQGLYNIANLDQI